MYQLYRTKIRINKEGTTYYIQHLMEQETHSTLTFSKDTLVFKNNKTSEQFSITLNQSASQPLDLEIVSSNPDNYLIPLKRVRVVGGETVGIKMTLKLYQDISEFNYIQNKLFILKQAATELVLLKTLHLSVMLDPKPQQLPQHLRRYLMKHLKIQRFSHTSNPLQYSQFQQIMAECSKYGTVSKVRQFSNHLIIQFKKPVKYQPSLIISQNCVFTMCYLSTFMGGFKLFTVGEEKEVAKNVDYVTMLDKEIVCLTSEEVYVYSSLDTEPKRSPHRKYSIYIVSPYLFIIVSKYKLFAYKSLSKVKEICTKEFIVNCIASNNDSMVIAFQRYMLLGTAQVKSRMQQLMVCKSLSELQYQKSIKVGNSPNSINGLQCKNNLIFAYCFPTMYIFHSKTKQLLGKIEKQISRFTILEGTYAENYVNILGISYNDRLFKVNVQQMDTFVGSEVLEFDERCLRVCVNCEGYVYLLTHERIVNYNLRKSIIMEVLLNAEEDEIFLDMSINKSDELLVLKSKRQVKYIQILKLS